jgi:short-subunit dehydrogenase
MDKVIAITGASAGIGRHTALCLARAGAAVAICARRSRELDEVADDIRRLGGRALPVVADVSREEEVKSFVDRTIEYFGRLDVMICNAGFGIYGTIDTIPGADMRRLLDVNYMGTYYAAGAALKAFRRQGSGHIIVISSIVGKRGIPYAGAYSATKFAQAGLVECLRSELDGSGIHATTVYPISTDTEFFDVLQRESGPMATSGGPRQSADEVAEAIAWAIERPVAEVFPHRWSRGLAILNAVAPAFCDRLVKRWGRRPVHA